MKGIATKRRMLLGVLLSIMCHHGVAYGQLLTEDEDIFDVITATRRCVVAISAKHGTHHDVLGTGFLLTIQSIPVIVTARQFIATQPMPGVTVIGDKDLYLGYRTKSDTTRTIPMSQLPERDKTGWLVHGDHSVDLALLPLPSLPDDMATAPIPESAIAGIDALAETMRVFTVSFQPEVTTHMRFDPIFRKSRICTISDTKKYMIDGTFLPENTGAPVFLEPHWSLTDIPPKKVQSKLVGIVSTFLVYHDIGRSKRTGRVRINFEENMSIGVVFSPKVLYEIITHRPNDQRWQKLKESKSKK